MPDHNVMTLVEHLERVWVVDCSRCANEGLSYNEDSGDADMDLICRGWSREGGRIYCPACNGEMRRQ